MNWPRSEFLLAFVSTYANTSNHPPVSSVFRIWILDSRFRLHTVLPRRFLSARRDDHSDDDQPGDQEANARTYSEGVEHRKQEYEEKPRSP